MANEKIFPKAYDEYQTSAKNSVQLLAKIANHSDVFDLAAEYEGGRILRGGIGA